jgi:hypothetical protein
VFWREEWAARRRAARRAAARFNSGAAHTARGRRRRREWRKIYLVAAGDARVGIAFALRGVRRASWLAVAAGGSTAARARLAALGRLSNMNKYRRWIHCDAVAHL